MRYFYVPWLVFYYVWVFLILGPRIKSRSYQTLYDRVVSQECIKSTRALCKPCAATLPCICELFSSNSPCFIPCLTSPLPVLPSWQGSTSRVLHRMFRLFGVQTSRRLYKKAVYMLMHLAMGMVTCALATLFWHSRIAHSSFILAICGASVWNAAGFYFTVFTKRYVQING